MYSISLNHCSPAIFLSHVADTQKIKVVNNNIILPSLAGGGYVKAFTFKNGIECLVSDYNFKEDFHLHKLPLAWEFFILRIDVVSHSANRVMMVNRKYDNELNTNKYSLVLLSSLEEFTFVASKNSQVKTLEIFIPRQWLIKKLGIHNGEEILKTYLNFKGRRSQINFFTSSFIKQFTGIITSAKMPKSDTTSFEKNINSLVNTFISNLIPRLQELSNEKKARVVNEEIKRLMDVKDYLLQDLSVPPTFLSLKNVAAMSGTALKTKFRKMYGVNIYEYFQEMRMEKARILLLSFQYCVKDVGRQVGYANLSNFSIAFKKEFGCLPSKFVQLHKEFAFANKQNAAGISN